MSAVLAVEALGSAQGPVEVVGTGVLADEIRRVLGQRVWAGPPDTRPSAVIETTGEAAALMGSLQRVADLGTVVLAGPLLARSLDLDLYEDLHVRGLTLIGVLPDAD